MMCQKAMLFRDRICGISLSMKDEKRFAVHEWQGQNLFGSALMCVGGIVYEIKNP